MLAAPTPINLSIHDLLFTIHGLVPLLSTANAPVDHVKKQVEIGPRESLR
jgi:hypothetical protein